MGSAWTEGGINDKTFGNSGGESKTYGGGDDGSE